MDDLDNRKITIKPKDPSSNKKSMKVKTKLFTKDQPFSSDQQNLLNKLMNQGVNNMRKELSIQKMVNILTKVQLNNERTKNLFTRLAMKQALNSQTQTPTPIIPATTI